MALSRLARASPTTKADETLAAVRDFFRREAGAGGVAALGVGAFGPVVINPDDPLYGRLLPNPKPGWSGVDLLAGLAGVTRGPIALTTDVAAAGVAEAEQGALSAARIGVYVTIGTGIGAAVVVDRRPLPALLHPEMGHLRLRLRPEDPGRCVCRFHDDCAEGLVAGPAILARWGRPLNEFAPDGPELALAADYAGQLLASIVLAVSPQRIVLGGAWRRRRACCRGLRPPWRRRSTAMSPTGATCPDTTTSSRRRSAMRPASPVR